MDEKPKIGNALPSETHELAGVFARLMASIIDGFLIILLLIAVLLILGIIGGDGAASLLRVIGLAVPVGYHWYFWTRRDGQTPGKFALGICVIKADGSPLSDTDAVIRAIGYNVSSICFGLGYIWAIFDKNNQSWHDKLARTYVVKKDQQRHTVDV